MTAEEAAVTPAEAAEAAAAAGAGAGEGEESAGSAAAVQQLADELQQGRVVCSFE
jgi:hypothetical protein